jgi:hypothetical protein
LGKSHSTGDSIAHSAAFVKISFEKNGSLFSFFPISAARALPSSSFFQKNR